MVHSQQPSWPTFLPFFYSSFCYFLLPYFFFFFFSNRMDHWGSHVIAMAIWIWKIIIAFSSFNGRLERHKWPKMEAAGVYLSANVQRERVRGSVRVNSIGSHKTSLKKETERNTGPEKTNGRKRETKKIKSVTPSALTNFTLFSSLLTLSSFLPVCLTWPLTLETHHLNKRLRPRPRTTERKKPRNQKNKKLRIRMACVCPYTLYSRQQSGPISGYLKNFSFLFPLHMYIWTYIYIFTLKTFFQESTTHRNIKSNILPCRVCL